MRRPNFPWVTLVVGASLYVAVTQGPFEGLHAGFLLALTLGVLAWAWDLFSTVCGSVREELGSWVKWLRRHP